MIPLVLDVETTIKNKGNPYTKENKLCYVGEFDGENVFIDRVFDPGISDGVLVQRNSYSNLIVGFNLKFDLTWLRRYGIDYSTCTIWDCQLARFLLSGQTEAYPSLDSTANYYGLGSKLSSVATEYWDKGIDTDQIPVEVLTEYLEQDLRLTWQVYEKQLEEFEKNPQLYKLFKLQCEDLLTLLEMEWNGQVVDVATCKQKEEEAEEQIKQIEKELQKFVGDVPVNFSSNDHISCILYGGTIVHETRVPIGVFKSGSKAGQPRYKVVEYEFKFPRLVEPSKGSELKKEGYFSTDESNLRSLKGGKSTKKFVDRLLDRSRLEKLRGTYYHGIPEKIDEVNPFDGRLHGQFNQCVARTGRLSSSKPNLQNLPPEMKQLMVTEYV